MVKDLQIENIIGREVMDSRGNPTVQAEVILRDGSRGIGTAPSGASTGIYEALELRDGDKTRYHGKGVQKAVHNVNGCLFHALKGMDAACTYQVDAAMQRVDGTGDKSRLGANSILAVSIACARAAANSLRLPLYRFLGGVYGSKLPVPMMNILNGGAHASNTVDVQEFMIMPVGAPDFKEGLRWCSEVFWTLRGLLIKDGHSTGVGDEGGFAPNLGSDEEVLDYLVRAIGSAGFRPGEDFKLALDAAASEWKAGTVGRYRMPKAGTQMSTEELINHWECLCGRYPIASIEDALDEEDWDGWQLLTQRLGRDVQLVGDDLFVTNTKRLKKGIQMGCGNAILIKLNQIGSLSETMAAVQMAQDAGFKVIVSHRSGETEDTTIADFSVAVNAGQIKTGAPCRSERVAKYNRLLQIEEELH